MKVGYVRIFDNDQDLSGQLVALQNAGCKQIFTDRIRAVQKEHPGLETTLSYMRNGDTLVVYQLKHLGRSLKDLVDTVNRLGELGYEFHSLREDLDTTTSDGQLIFRAFATLAEFQHNIMREQTRKGLQAARARGRAGGRPKKLDVAKTELLYTLYDEKQESIPGICRLLGVSKSTLYTYLKSREE